MPRLIGTLSPQAPYNFPLVLDILRRYAHPTLDHVRENAYWRTLHIDVDRSAGANGWRVSRREIRDVNRVSYLEN